MKMTDDLAAKITDVNEGFGKETGVVVLRNTGTFSCSRCCDFCAAVCAFREPKVETKTTNRTY